MISPQTYTPQETANILKLSKNTIYDLISKGEIVAKRIGSVYRIPASSLSFALTGLDIDLYEAQKEDLKNIKIIQKEIKKTRKKLT